MAFAIAAVAGLFRNMLLSAMLLLMTVRQHAIVWQFLPGRLLLGAAQMGECICVEQVPAWHNLHDGTQMCPARVCMQTE